MFVCARTETCDTSESSFNQRNTDRSIHVFMYPAISISADTYVCRATGWFLLLKEDKQNMFFGYILIKLTLAPLKTDTTTGAYAQEVLCSIPSVYELTAETDLVCTSGEKLGTSRHMRACGYVERLEQHVTLALAHQ